MWHVFRFLGSLGRRSTVFEVLGLSLLAVGLHEVYPPAALIFAGAALVFIAQGLERGR